MRNKINKWITRTVGAVVGWTIYSALSSGSSLEPMKWLTFIYEKVGITVIALVPLALWAVYTSLKSRHGTELTLAYIGATAQRVGLLGTVIGIVAATVTIGDSLGTGAAMAVTGALPAVGQALVSTAVGFVIAIICDFFIYLGSKNLDREEANE